MKVWYPVLRMEVKIEKQLRCKDCKWCEWNGRWWIWHCRSTVYAKVNPGRFACKQFVYKDK